MLKKVGVTIRSEQYSISEVLYDTFGQDDSFDTDEEALAMAMASVRRGVDELAPQFSQAAPESEEDVIEIFTEGRLKVRDGDVTLTYKEEENSGLGTVENILRFRKQEPSLITMLRFGEVNTNLLFEEGKRTKCFYQMPFGSLELVIRTASVDNRLLTDGVLVLDYYIEFRGAGAEHKCVTIRLTQSRPD